MPSHNFERTNDDIQFVISKLLREVKDPRVQQGMISVTRVETGLKDEKEFRRGLRSASGYLRKELGNSMKLRYTPELVFEIDHSIEYGAHINEVINSLEINHDGDEENENQ